jgi:hypothetical protein
MRILSGDRRWIAVLGAAFMLGHAAPAAQAFEGRNSAREPARPGRPGSLPVVEPFRSRPPRPTRTQPVAITPSTPATLPAWKDLERAVAEHFATLKDYKSDDILARGDVEPLLAAVKKLGWQPDDWKDILADVLPESDELVRTLRTPRGRVFMRKIGTHPEGYDRLDKLRALPQGREQVRDLVEAPDGYKLIEYMTTTEGGTALGKQLSQTKKGRRFNDPTGRIYTESALLKRLEASYRAARGEEPEAPEPAPGRGREQTTPGRRET